MARLLTEFDMKYALFFLLLITTLMPSASMRAMGVFSDDRRPQNWRFGIAPGLAFPVTASGGLERTITWAFDVSGRLPKSSVLVTGGYRYINTVTDIAIVPGTSAHAFTYDPFRAVALGLELELADQQRTLLPSARLAALIPTATGGAFSIETGLLLDLYLVAGGSLTLDVSMLTLFDPVQVITIPVRLGVRWGL